MTTQTKDEAPVLDFDHHAPKASYDRDSALGLVRSHPVFWTESYGGHWVVTSHPDIKRILKDPQTFTSGKSADGKTGGVNIPPLVGPGLLPGEADGDKHRQLRKILAQPFGRAAVDQMEEDIQNLVTRSIDAVIEKRDFDVVHDVSDIVPAGAIVELLGFPESERVNFIKSIQAAFQVLPKLAQGAEPTPESERGEEAFHWAIEYIQSFVSSRRKNPESDLISEIVDPEHGLTDDECLWMIVTLIAGGAENPSALISNAMIGLAEDDALRAELIADPALIPSAVEEFLRHISAGVSLGRTVRAEVDVAGVRMQPGERVLLWLPAANHDHAVFEDPDSFDPNRSPCPHLAFGIGPHVCPGAMMARLEFRVLFEEVLERIPDFSVDLERAERFEDGGIMYGFTTIPALTNLSS